MRVDVQVICASRSCTTNAILDWSGNNRRREETGSGGGGVSKDVLEWLTTIGGAPPPPRPMGGGTDRVDPDSPRYIQWPPAGELNIRN